MSDSRRKGIMHFHSRASFDCLSSPLDILRFAQRHGLDFLIVTDHETIDGAIRLRELAHHRGLDLEIPLAAEYYTNYGDVIAAFIADEIHTRDFDQLIAEVGRQGGITLLPHPCRGHTNIDYVAAHVDLIEIYNSRQSVVDDRRSEELAKKYAKPVFYGSDAHLVADLASAIVTLDKKYDLKTDLLNNIITAETCQKTARLHVRFSQLVGAFRTGQLTQLFMRKLLRMIGRNYKS